MPEFPKKETQSISTGGSVSFNPNIPTWKRLSGYVLESDGWTKVGKLYMKGENTIDYTGTHWILNRTTRIEFLEEIKQ